MTAVVPPHLVPLLRAEPYAIVHLVGEAARSIASLLVEASEAPVALLRRAEGVTVIAPLDRLAGAGLDVAALQRWRALSLEGVAEARTFLVLREATAVLNEVGSPLLAVATGPDLLLLVPDLHLGRALAALAQARLDRFA
jgi:hypothetical protein